MESDSSVCLASGFYLCMRLRDGWPHLSRSLRSSEQQEEKPGREFKPYCHPAHPGTFRPSPSSSSATLHQPPPTPPSLPPSLSSPFSSSLSSSFSSFPFLLSYILLFLCIFVAFIAMDGFLFLPFLYLPFLLPPLPPSPPPLLPFA